MSSRGQKQNNGVTHPNPPHEAGLVYRERSASTRAQPPLQHHGDGDPTWRPDNDLPVEGKGDGRGYEGRVFRPLLSGRT